MDRDSVVCGRAGLFFARPDKTAPPRALVLVEPLAVNGVDPHRGLSDAPQRLSDASTGGLFRRLGRLCAGHQGAVKPRADCRVPRPAPGGSGAAYSHAQYVFDPAGGASAAQSSAHASSA
jgi:hypothetical protein